MLIPYIDFHFIWRWIIISDKKILEFKNISNKISEGFSLNNINLEIEKETIHGILGNERSGKLEIIKILTGITKADAGEIIYKGESVEFNNFKDSFEQGIFTIHQQYEDSNDDVWSFLKGRKSSGYRDKSNFFLNMSVVENIFFGREPKVGFGILSFINKKKMFREAQKLFEELNIDLDPNIKMGNLSYFERLLTALAKAVYYQCELIIINEPTKMLSAEEKQKLFRIINSLKNKEYSFIYLSEEIDIILEISDKVTVLKNGRKIGTEETSNLDFDKLSLMFLGKKI